MTTSFFLFFKHLFYLCHHINPYLKQVFRFLPFNVLLVCLNISFVLLTNKCFVLQIDVSTDCSSAVQSEINYSLIGV